MSYLECNPNHCPSIKEIGKNLVVQELKIKQLEAEKAELIELANSMLIFIPVDALEIYFSDKEVELIKQIQAEVKS